jgi:hypothetical protein
VFWFSVNWKNQVEALRSGGLVLAFDFSLSPGLGEPLVVSGKDALFFAKKLVRACPENS